MSPRLKRLSGSEVITIFSKLGFQEESRRGSHVKLVRIGAQGSRQVLTIPDHDELDVGTVRAIIRQATRFVDEVTLRKYFYVK